MIEWVRKSTGHNLVFQPERDYLVFAAEGEGQIHDLSFGTNEMIIGGVEYQVSQTARVEIAGTFGAFTMLTKGMLVEFTYMHHADGRREIIEMREVAEVEEF